MNIAGIASDNMNAIIESATTRNKEEHCKFDASDVIADADEGNGNNCDKANDVTTTNRHMVQDVRQQNDGAAAAAAAADDDVENNDDEGNGDDNDDGDDEDFTDFQQSPTQTDMQHQLQLQQQQKLILNEQLEVTTTTDLAQKVFDATLTPPPMSPSDMNITDDNSNHNMALLGYEEEVESLQPLSERWSPVGANYDDAITPNSELSPESELELLSSDSAGLDKQQQLATLAANNNDPAEMARLRSIEDEQELLTSSLMSLTTHFAHVQLRVRQIVEAPSHERDQLLKDLEEFAFRGIPEPMSALTPQEDDETAQQRQFELIEHLKSQLSELEKVAYESGAPVLPQHILVEKQKIIIDELKNKLNLRVEEQDLPELTSEELKHQVDNAIGEFVGPLKMKEQLVAQLKTQITDLERFIAFLQCDSDPKMKTFNGTNGKFAEAYNSYAAKKKGASARNKKRQQAPTAAASATSAASPSSSGNVRDEQTEVSSTAMTQVASTQEAASSSAASGAGVRESLNSKAHGLMDKASLLMQMFATTHFGSKAEQFQKNSLKKTHKGNHWGDLRAQLEVDIQEVASLAATLSFDREKLAKMKLALKKSSPRAQGVAGPLTTVPLPRTTQPHSTKQLQSYPVSSDSDEEDAYDCYNWEKKARRADRHGGDSIITISKELTTAVRKNFAMTLLRLIQHGLRVETESATSSLIVPFMRCLNPSPVFAAEHNQRAAPSSSAAASFLGYSTAPAPYGAHNDFDEDEQAAARTAGSRQMHAWELILEYYYLKHGDEYNNTPARKLSQSFNLDIVDAQVITPKQNLLSAIGQIIAMHRPYKRSLNAHFKAFICAGLNARQLVDWLNLIFSCNDLIDMYYTADSYVVRTGFRDSLRSIDALSKYEFDLPVDLAVRHFRNI